MTMVPAPNHHYGQHLYGSYVGSCGGAGRYRESFGGGGDHLINGSQVCEYSTTTTVTEYYSCLGSDLRPPPMAEDESTTNSFNEEAASNRDDGWLQLSIGGGGGNKHDQRDSITTRSSGLVELDLLPGGGGAAATASLRRDSRTPADHPILQAPQIPANSRFVSNFLSPPIHNFGDETAITMTATATATATPLFFGTSGSSHFVQQEINWAFRPMAGVAQVPSSSPSTSSASSSFLPVGGRRSSYFSRPLVQFQSSGVDAAGPSSDLRIINPPRRPHSGIWFTLKALENQAKQPFLPQISKNYLRIKDDKTTVRLVMKYLANKLHLESESEIEIRCRGQHVGPFLTLQHVRDSIWTTSTPDSLFTFLPDSSTTQHLMVLHYGRI